MKRSAGISNQNGEVDIPFLNQLLSDEYVLYTKTRTAHWTVDGARNYEMHVVLENQHNALDEIIDKIAERIRSLGHFALGSLKDFLSNEQMCDDNRNFSKSNQIFETLLTNHEMIIRIIRKEIFSISNNLSHIETVNFISMLMDQHEKMANILKAFSSNSQISSPKYMHLITKQNTFWLN